MPNKFAQELWAAGHLPKITQHPFVTAIAEGRLPLTALQAYARELIALAAGFPAQLAQLLARCEHTEARKIMLANLLEEEGVVAFSPASGLQVEPQRNHAEMGNRFLRALGLPNIITPPPQGQWLTNELAAGRWLGAFSYFCVGMEANVPATFRLIAGGLRDHYGLHDDDLAYFTEHFIADERHGEHGAAVAAMVATDESKKQEALTGAQRGAQAWWHFHQQHLRASRSQFAARA